MLNTAIIPTLPIAQVASLAQWQAQQALRCGRRGDAEGFAVHTNKMYDVLEAAAYPRLTTAEVVRALGRSKALVLKIERPIINFALGR